MSRPKNITRTWLTLLRATDRLKKAIDSQFKKDFNTSLSRFDILSALNRAGPSGLRAGELTQSLMVSVGNTTQVITPLINEGYVRKLMIPEDGRVTIYKLTEEGHRLFDQMAFEHHAWMKYAFVNLTDEELKALLELIKKLNLPNVQHS